MNLMNSFQSSCRVGTAYQDACGYVTLINAPAGPAPRTIALATSHSRSNALRWNA